MLSSLDLTQLAFHCAKDPGCLVDDLDVLCCGALFESDRALHIFRGNGCNVDSQQEKFSFPPDLVQDRQNGPLGR